MIIMVAIILAGCSGGGGSSSFQQGSTATASPTPTPPAGPPTTPSGQCSLRERQLWAEAQIREWYLFPEDLPASINPDEHSTLSSFINALTANARAQNKDRFFTFATSIAEENAFFSQGQTTAFGFRIAYDGSQRRVFVLDAFEDGPALAAGIDRGAEILAIGTSPDSMELVSSLAAQGGLNAISNALGPATAAVTRTIQFRRGSQTQSVTITKAVFNVAPISPRYGVAVLPDGADGQVGYVNLRTFVSSAGPALEEAFGRFRTAGIERVIIDYRYNGGGLVRIAELSGDLVGRNRLPSDVYSITAFRPSKSAENSTRLFRNNNASIGASRIAFITTSSSASASELVINSMLPYLGRNLAMVGTNTGGKPVGQIAIDRATCDDRLRIVAFATQNRDRQGDYFNGLASILNSRGARTCAAADDITRIMGNPSEGMTARALSALNGIECSPIDTGATRTSSLQDSVFRLGGPAEPVMVTPSQPNAAQREMPGLF